MAAPKKAEVVAAVCGWGEIEFRKESERGFEVSRLIRNGEIARFTRYVESLGLEEKKRFVELMVKRMNAAMGMTSQSEILSLNKDPLFGGFLEFEQNEGVTKMSAENSYKFEKFGHIESNRSGEFLLASKSATKELATRFSSEFGEVSKRTNSEVTFNTTMKGFEFLTLMQIRRPLFDIALRHEIRANGALMVMFSYPVVPIGENIWSVLDQGDLEDFIRGARTVGGTSMAGIRSALDALEI